MERIIKIILAVIIIGAGSLFLVGGENLAISILGFLVILFSVNWVFGYIDRLI